MKKLFTMIFSISVMAVASNCAHKAEEPPKATMTATGETTYRQTPAGMAANEKPDALNECKQVISCYSALARDLCMHQEPECVSNFEVTAPVDNKQTCENMLKQAKDIAKPYVENRKDYDFPNECG